MIFISGELLVTCDEVFSSINKIKNKIYISIYISRISFWLIFDSFPVSIKQMRSIFLKRGVFFFIFLLKSKRIFEKIIYHDFWQYREKNCPIQKCRNVFCCSIHMLWVFRRVQMFTLEINNNHNLLLHNRDTSSKCYTLICNPLQ